VFTETKFAEASPTTADRLLPHGSIRHLLSLHAKVSPEKVFIIHYNGDGRREELAFAEVNARAHQTANMLQDDFAAKPGDTIAVMVANPADAAVFYLAAWIIGAVVVPLYPTDDDAALASKLRQSHASICLVGYQYLIAIQAIASPDSYLVQVGGLPHVSILYFNELVKNLPNTFFNDHAAPTLDSPALWVSNAVRLSQGDLLSAAQNFALAQAFTGNQRMMTLLPFHNVNEIICSLLMPLRVGGSVVLKPDFSPDMFWRHITSECVQIASVTPAMLQACIDFADAQLKHGEPIWGSGIYLQDLTRFRHLICASANLDTALVKTFQERLGLTVYQLTPLEQND
jgi:long-chain acyl-CoA synthetase